MTGGRKPLLAISRHYSNAFSCCFLRQGVKSRTRQNEEVYFRACSSAGDTHLLSEEDYSSSRWSLLQSPLCGLISSFPAVFSLSNSKISGVETYCQYVQLLLGSLNATYLMTSLSLSTGEVPRTACLHAWIPGSLGACALHTEALAKLTFNQGNVNLRRILFFQYFFFSFLKEKPVSNLL